MKKILLSVLLTCLFLGAYAQNEIKGDNYRVWVDGEVINFDGVVALGWGAYNPMTDMLEKVVTEHANGDLYYDLRKCSSMDEAGQSMLTVLAIQMRKVNVRLIARGSKSAAWQIKYLPNLKKFNQNFELVFMD